VVTNRSREDCAMKRKRIELPLMLTIIMLFPVVSMAQDDMSFDEDDMSFDEDDMSFDEGDMSLDEDASAPGDDAGTDAGADVGAGGLVDLSDLGLGAGQDAGLGITDDKSREKVDEAQLLIDRHPIWAVQQVYALRKGRFDFQPSFGLSLNDPFVQRQAVNLGLGYYITEVLAIGVTFNWYRFLQNETDVNYRISRATHQTVPINDYFWGLQLNMTYVPVYGKFAFFKDWIIHWDIWIVGGGGVISSRPIPVIDPDYRSFDFKIKPAFNIGIGARLYLARFLAVFFEVRDYIYAEEVESLVTYSDPNLRQRKSNWYDDDKKLTNNVMLQVGISLFLPFTFEFKLPK
jgi:outer membrane beta-barrel protein